MSSIWYGKVKPHMEVFQTKFVEEVGILMKGFTVLLEERLEQNFKLIVNRKVAGLVAKVQSVNFILYHGRFGCCSCLHPGQRTPGRGNKCVYPCISTVYPQQTHVDTLTYAQLAAKTGELVFGVKGSSVVHSILQITVMLFNYMHQVHESKFTR